MAIVFTFSPTLNHLHPLHSRLVVDEDDNGKLRPERVKALSTTILLFNLLYYFEMKINERFNMKCSVTN